MLLAHLVAVSDAVAATPARSIKIGLIAGCLRVAGATDSEIAAAYLAGDLLQRRTGVGWATLRDVPDPAANPTLTLANVDETFARIATDSGAGSQGRRTTQVDALFASATAAEQAFLRALVAGEIRQGAQDGVMVEAIAKAAEVTVADVRRAFMLRG